VLTLTNVKLALSFHTIQSPSKCWICPCIAVSDDGGNEPVQDGSDGLPYNNTVYILVEQTLSPGSLFGLRLYVKERSPVKIQVWKPSGSPSLDTADFTLRHEVELTPPTPGYYRVSDLASILQPSYSKGVGNI
jgi:hypothetical protein